jgi:hypothetical protein
MRTEKEGVLTQVRVRQAEWDWRAEAAKPRCRGLRRQDTLPIELIDLLDLLVMASKKSWKLSAEGLAAEGQVERGEGHRPSLAESVGKTHGRRDPPWKPFRSRHLDPSRGPANGC